MVKNVTFNVGMTCGGCSGAVTRILKKFEGVTEVNADVEKKLVVVNCESTISDEDMLAALKKWSDASGKSVEFVGSEEA